MEILWWTLTILLMAAGLLGAVFPIIPDSLLILAGAFLNHFALPGKGAGWLTLCTLVVLCILAHIVDFTAGAMGAKKFGASKWGAVGGFIGSIVGLFFFPFGLFLGPVIGVLAAEVILANKTLGPAAKSSWGTFLGTLAGMAGKIVIAVTMVATFFLGWYLRV